MFKQLLERLLKFLSWTFFAALLSVFIYEWGKSDFKEAVKNLDIYNQEFAQHKGQIDWVNARLDRICAGESVELYSNEEVGPQIYSISSKQDSSISISVLVSSPCANRNMIFTRIDVHGVEVFSPSEKKLLRVSEHWMNPRNQWWKWWN